MGASGPKGRRDAASCQLTNAGGPHWRKCDPPAPQRQLPLAFLPIPSAGPPPRYGPGALPPAAGWDSSHRDQLHAAAPGSSSLRLVPVGLRRAEAPCQGIAGGPIPPESPRHQRPPRGWGHGDVPVRVPPLAARLGGGRGSSDGPLPVPSLAGTRPRPLGGTAGRPSSIIRAGGECGPLPGGFHSPGQPRPSPEPRRVRGETSRAGGCPPQPLAGPSRR